MEEKKVLDRLQRLCSKAEYCTSDIRRKALKAMEGDAAAADRIVKSLVKEKYVDNLRYSSAFAREKSSLQGWGAIKIRFALRGKGISDETISEALEEIDGEQASKKMEKLLEAKYKSLAQDPAGKLKLLRYALGRGYSYDEVAPAVERLFSD